MLVLTRKVGEVIVINGVIRIKIVGAKGKQVRVGISAPPDVVVDRAEVAYRREFQLEIMEAPRTKRELAWSR
jgi:carbon storage regulator